MSNTFSELPRRSSSADGKQNQDVPFTWVVLAYLWSWVVLFFDMGYKFIDERFPNIILIAKDIKVMAENYIFANLDTINEIQQFASLVWQKIGPTVYKMTHSVSFWFTLPFVMMQTVCNLYATAFAIPCMVTQHMFRKPANLGGDYYQPGRFAMITGAGEGVGRNLAIHLWKQGWSLVCLDADKFALLRLDEKLREMTIHGIASSHQRKYMYNCDAGNRQVDFNKTFASEVKDTNIRLKPVDITLLFNSVAYRPGTVPFSKLDGEDLDRAILTNVMFATQLTQHLLGASIVSMDDETKSMAGKSALKYKLASEHKSCIVNVSSFAGEVPLANDSVYGGTMAYVASWSKCLKKELRASEDFPSGVSVVCTSFADMHLDIRGPKNILEAKTSEIAQNILNSIGLEEGWFGAFLDYPKLLEGIAFRIINGFPSPFDDMAATALINFIRPAPSQGQMNMTRSSLQRSRISKPATVKPKEALSEASSRHNSPAKASTNPTRGRTSKPVKQKSAEKRSTGTPTHLRQGSSNRTGSPLSQPPMMASRSSSGASKKSDSHYYPGGDPNNVGFDLGSRRPVCPKTPYGTPKSPREFESGGDRPLAVSSPAGSTGSNFKYTHGRNAMVANYRSSSPDNDSDLSQISLLGRETTVVAAMSENKPKRAHFYKSGVNPQISAEVIKSKKTKLDDAGNDADTEDERDFSFTLTPQHMVGNQQSPVKSPNNKENKTVLAEEPVPTNVDQMKSKSKTSKKIKSTSNSPSAFYSASEDSNIADPLVSSASSPVKRPTAADFVAGQRRTRSRSPKKSKSRKV